MNLKPQSLILLLIIGIMACSEKTDKLSEKNGVNVLIIEKTRQAKRNILVPGDDTYEMDYKQINLDSFPPPRIVPFSLIIDTTSENKALANQTLADVSSISYADQTYLITPGKNQVPLPQKVLANGTRINIHPEKRPVNLVPSIRALNPKMKKEANLDIQFWTEDEGLPSALISNLLQDQKGNFWIGTTDNGVSRFDGSYFTHFSAGETWYGKWINQLSEDEDGNIWISSRSDIRCYDGKEYIIYPWNQKISRFLGQKEDHSWFGHRDSGLIFRNEDQYLHFHKFNGLHSHVIRGVYIDQHLHSWLYGKDGVSRFDGTYFTHYTSAEGLIDMDVKQIIEDRKGRLYLLTAKGISRWDNEGFTNFPADLFFHNSQLNYLLEDNQGKIWVSSSNGLFHMTDEEVFHFTMSDSFRDKFINHFWLDKKGRISFRTNNGFIQFDGKVFLKVSEEDGLNIGFRMNDLVVDRQNQVWMGSLPGGINRYQPNGFNHYGKKNGLSGDRVWALEEDQNGNIWIGTLDDGINIFTEKGIIHLGKEQGLLDNIIRAITADRKGNIWIGSSKGLTKFDGQSFTFFTQAQGIEGVESIMEDSQGRLWIGTSQKGIFLFDQQSVQHYYKDRYSFNYFFEDSQGRVWTKMPFETGVICFQNNGFVKLSSDQEFPNKEIHSILEDSRGIIWLGTHQGLYYLNDQGFRLIENNVALANDNIVSIMEDPHNRLWIATNKGLHLLVMDKENQEPGGRNDQFFFFGKSDGIRNFDFSYNATLIDSQNRIWWGRLRRGKGAMMAHLDAFEIEETPAEYLHLSDVYINQQFVNFRQIIDTTDELSSVLEDQISYDSVAYFYNYPIGLVLPYHLNHLTFYFSALDWAAPHKIKYQYKMEGLDERWSEPQSEPFADYRNIPPGQHTIHIRAMSSSQKWGAPIEYSFRVLPPGGNQAGPILLMDWQSLGLFGSG
jgi:ligand-binding sensor domain-containing protein